MKEGKELDQQVKTMLVWLAAYEVAHEFRLEKEEQNRREQQQEIEPLFAARFPELSAKGETFATSWKFDMENDIEKWEEEDGIEAICDRIANKNRDVINSLMRSEKVSEIALCNSALDILESEAAGYLTSEQMHLMREKINSQGWTYERQRIREFIVNFAENKRKAVESIA